MSMPAFMKPAPSIPSQSAGKVRHLVRQCSFLALLFAVPLAASHACAPAPESSVGSPEHPRGPQRGTLHKVDASWNYRQLSLGPHDMLEVILPGKLDDDFKINTALAGLILKEKRALDDERIVFVFGVDSTKPPGMLIIRPTTKPGQWFSLNLTSSGLLIETNC